MTFRDMRPPIPLAVIGGYLGAGKTTMVNALLTNPLGRRITVLVNDFGSVNIDASLIRARSDDVIGLENGCICCSIGGKLMETLIEIGARDQRPDLLVIESSGVSDPVRIAQVGMLDRAYRLSSIVVAVDAERIETTLADPYVGEIARRQIEGATALVLTKTDLIAADAVQAARARVMQRARTRIVCNAEHGAVPYACFFNDAVARPAGVSLRADVQLPFELSSFTFRSDRRFRRRALKEACLSFSARLLRAKGFVRLEGGEYAEVHIVGHRWQITKQNNPQINGTELVFIGIFDEDERANAYTALEAAACDPIPVP
jgi:G3E family GTPase